MAKNGRNRAKRNVERAVAQSPGTPYWLIVKDGNGLVEEIFTMDLDGSGEALPVFRFREEAETFLGPGNLGDGWRVRESGAGETVSVLYSLCADVERVALDPSSEAMTGRTDGFVVLSRKSFAARATQGGKAPQPRD